MGLSVQEQEFNITHSRGDDYVEMYVSDSTYITKLDRLVQECPEAYSVTKEYYCQDELIGKLYKFPTNLLSFRHPREKKELTNEQRQEIADRLNKSRRK